MLHALAYKEIHIKIVYTFDNVHQQQIVVIVAVLADDIVSVVCSASKQSRRNFLSVSPAKSRRSRANHIGTRINKNK